MLQSLPPHVAETARCERLIGPARAAGACSALDATRIAQPGEQVQLCSQCRMPTAVETDGAEMAAWRCGAEWAVISAAHDKLDDAGCDVSTTPFNAGCVSEGPGMAHSGADQPGVRGRESRRAGKGANTGCRLAMKNHLTQLQWTVLLQSCRSENAECGPTCRCCRRCTTSSAAR